MLEYQQAINSLWALAGGYARDRGESLSQLGNLVDLRLAKVRSYCGSRTSKSKV